MAAARERQITRLVIAIDNKSVQEQAVHMVARPDKLPKHNTKMWKIITAYMVQFDSIDFLWVPSHGKKTELAPPHRFLPTFDATFWCGLNDVADTECTKIIAGTKTALRLHT